LKKVNKTILGAVVALVIIIYSAIGLYHYYEVSKQQRIQTQDAYGYWPFLDQPSEETSIIQLIASSEKYDEKTVVVMGVICVREGSNALFLSREDYQYSTTNCVSLDFNYEELGVSEMELTHLSGKHIRLVGTYDKDIITTLRFSAGCIKNITAIVDMEYVAAVQY
jgi:hypothetical protein